jgi:tetratricopeptide (TPR) repeat protein
MRENVPALGYNLNQTGLLYRVSRGNTGAAAGAVSGIWKRYATRGFADVEARPSAGRYRRDVWLRSALCVFLIKKTFQHLGAGENEEAFATLARVEPLAYGLFEALANVGGIYLARGQPEKAASFFDRAARAVPRQGRGDDYFRFHYANLLAAKGNAYLAAGDPAAAEAAYEESRKAYPADRPGAPADAGTR